MSLLNRLSIRRKLLLLTLLVLVAISIPAAFQVHQARDLAQAAQGELDGLAPARQLVRLTQLTQQHRGLSAAMLGGNAAVQSGREAKNTEVARQFELLDGMLKTAAASDAMRRTWQDARTRWGSLSGRVGAKDLKAAESSTLHAELIAVYFRLLDQLVDQSGLILDPEAASYFLVNATLIRLPTATEALGQTRARGAGFLAEGQIGPEGRTLLAGLVAQAGDQQQGMSTAFDKSFAVDAALKSRLGGKIAALQEQVAAALKLTREELIQKDALSYAAPDYIGAYTRTIDAMFAADEDAMDALDGLLRERVSSLRMSSWIVFGLLAFMLLVVFLFVRSISRSITLPLQHAAGLAQQIAARDLSGDVVVRARDEIGELTRALLAMRDSLCGVIGEVRSNAGEVARAAQELASGNQDLSQRTEQQASALEETASSMEELTATVRSNADQAGDASGLAQRARNVAISGGEAVEQVVRTMGAIEASSRRIEEIIAVIDGIAFQTNILALNAAVEAARAGEQGRGFAVVASEVRALAQRSAEAAKQIKQLIAESVGQVESGSRLVQGAGTTMRETVDAIRSLTELVGSISRASSEQSSGIGQIGEAVSHMDQLTQQNAALVEQTAAAGLSLQQQAEKLAGIVNTFRMPVARH
ncbi:methyl-accepting chemotaxis protein [Roseateles saccharophilus]|uniref:Methyl-accepting chemotaxis protein n=1 Tax=Roseateles saccharophilus TaxID=304 RepID=A0A4R3UNN2_ROSSA|nr:methyl-accepting chemotaxis protein [Roseateles saccharophilus]MDG0834287.1 methyl-accepting chemotaxis protein [Roseateles saccharophilus]TCU91898.1 methyl-accepting chemotaxis protein [Roseateles saccharophilus]